MQSGRLRDRVVFEARTVTGNAVTWAYAFTVDAHAERFDEQGCNFTVRYRSGVTPSSHRILWDDCIWTIVSAVHDQKRRQFTIVCNFSNLVEATHLQSTETEYVDAVPVLRPRE